MTQRGRQERIAFFAGNKAVTYNLITKKQSSHICENDVLALGLIPSNELVVVEGDHQKGLSSLKLRNLNTLAARSIFPNDKTMYFGDVSFSGSGDLVLIDCTDPFRIVRTSDLFELPFILTRNRFSKGRVEFIDGKNILAQNYNGQSFSLNLNRYANPLFFPGFYRYVAVGISKQKLLFIKKDTLIEYDTRTKKTLIRKTGLTLPRSFIGAMEREFEVKYDDVANLLYCKSGSMALSVEVWDVKTGDRIASFIDTRFFPLYGTRSCVLNYKGQGLVKYNFNDESTTKLLSDDNLSISRFTLSPDHSLVVTSNEDSVIVRRMDDMRIVNAFEFTDHLLGNLRISPDNKFLVATKPLIASLWNDKVGLVTGEVPPVKKQLYILSLQSNKLIKKIDMDFMNEIDLDFYDDQHLWVSFANDRLVTYTIPDGDRLPDVWANKGGGGVVAYTEDGNYLATPTVLWRVNSLLKGEYVRSDQIDIYRNRPDIVLSKFPQCRDTARIYHDLIRMRMKYANIDSTRATQLESFPQVTIDNKSSIPETTKESNIQLRLSATSQTDLASLNVLVNGRLIQVFNNLTGKTFSTTLAIFLTPGYNQIRAIAVNKLNLKSAEEGVITIYQSTDKPDCYVVGIGVGKYDNNKFEPIHTAEPDIDSLISFFKGNTSLYSHVHHLKLKSKEFTSNSLEQIRQFLSTAKINDRVVFFYEGHGQWSSKDGKYYLMTSAAKGNSGAGSVPLDDLRSVVNTTASRNVLMLINSCYAGVRDKEQENYDLMRNLFINQGIHSGVNIVTTSSGTTPTAFGHGQKNSTVISGLLSMKAYLKNPQTRVSISEFNNYLNQYFMMNYGRPLNYYQSNSINNFQIW